MERGKHTPERNLRNLEEMVSTGAMDAERRSHSSGVVSASVGDHSRQASDEEGRCGLKPSSRVHSAVLKHVEWSWSAGQCHV